MSKTTPELRRLWRDYECNEHKLVRMAFGPDSIRVAAPTVETWQAVAAVMARHLYHIRTEDTDSFNCRAITGGKARSLHAYGIALDVNWQTNPFRDHPGTRGPKFSPRASQDERARDVRAGQADTDMTEAMIDDIQAIRTSAGLPAVRWGGHFGTLKDAMHFEIEVGPQDLEAGIDWRTVNGTRPAV